MNEEAEDLLVKEKNMKGGVKRSELKDVTRHSKNEYLMKALIKHGKNGDTKLDKTKIRLKNLEGDCLMLALSVLFLGIIPYEERMNVRKELAERLLLKADI